MSDEEITPYTETQYNKLTPEQQGKAKLDWGRDVSNSVEPLEDMNEIRAHEMCLMATPWILAAIRYGIICAGGG
jgi:hypothetical protein